MSSVILELEEMAGNVRLQKATLPVTKLTWAVHKFHKAKLTHSVLER